MLKRKSQTQCIKLVGSARQPSEARASSKLETCLPPALAILAILFFDFFLGGEVLRVVGVQGFGIRAYRALGVMIS